MTFSRWLIAGALLILPAQMMAERGPKGPEKEADRAAVFAQADADGSGGLSADELKEFKSLMRERRAARMFSRLDADGDGAVSLDELKVARGKGHHGPPCDK